MGSHVAKVTVSLPSELLKLADRLAKERKTSRSGVISDLLRREETARVARLMEEGYRESASENLRLAEESLPAVRDALGKHTRWDESTRG